MKEKQAEFAKELQALLAKYNVDIQPTIEPRINIIFKDEDKGTDTKPEGSPKIIV